MSSNSTICCKPVPSASAIGPSTVFWIRKGDSGANIAKTTARSVVPQKAVWKGLARAMTFLNRVKSTTLFPMRDSVPCFCCVVLMVFCFLFMLQI